MVKFFNRFSLAFKILLTGSLPDRKRQDIPAITAGEVAEARAFYPLDKYFVYGHARSGTTLLTRLLRLHPQVHCNYQAHFFSRAPLLEALVADQDVGRWLGRKSNRWNQGRDLSPLVLRSVADFIMERDARRAGKAFPGCIVGDKSPNSLLDGQAVENLVKVYPDARLVFIVRDGRDAALSHRFQAFIDLPQHLNRGDQAIREDFIRDPAPYLAGQRSVFSEKAVRQAAEGWVKNVVETDGAARRLLPGQYISLRYEDLLSHPWQEMHRLWGFLGVDVDLPGLEDTVTSEMTRNPDADWQQEKAGDIAAALQKGKRGTWQELFTARDRQIFKEIAGQTLVDWNYEKDASW